MQKLSHSVFIKNWTVIVFIKTIVQLFFFSDVTNIEVRQVTLAGQFRSKRCLARTWRTCNQTTVDRTQVDLWTRLWVKLYITNTINAPLQLWNSITEVLPEKISANYSTRVFFISENIHSLLP